MPRETAYKIIIGILLATVIVLAAILILRQPSKPAALKVTKAARPIQGKIAIVIDDLGYNADNFSILEKINYPLTFSVLPNLNYSRSIAQRLHQRGAEIILHLPMEPYEKVNLEKNTILVSMDEARIKEIISENLANIVYAKGVSNHMGSLASEDAKTMGIIFRELKKRRLYFLDSFVTPKSLAASLAKETSLRFTRRDVFLDNSVDDKYIRRQLEHLKSKARLRGAAVGIGHDRKLTLEVLKEEMPQIEKEGYKFVLVSELVR